MPEIVKSHDNNDTDSVPSYLNWAKLLKYLIFRKIIGRTAIVEMTDMRNEAETAQTGREI